MFFGTLREKRWQCYVQSTKGEVDQLKAELNSAKDRIVELWQENCEQMQMYDDILAQGEQELQQLTKMLELRELELARLKASSLTEVTIPGFSGDA